MRKNLATSLRAIAKQSRFLALAHFRDFRLLRQSLRSLLAMTSLAISLFLIGCASIQPPPGGPEDKTPPMLDTVMPHQRELNVQRDSKIHFFFKRNIDRNSFTSSLSITPYLNGVVKYKWSGYDEVTITLPEQMRENTTYVVTLSKDLRTLRNAPLLAPIQIVFSTGNIIDTGRIAGTMLPPLNIGAPTDLSNISIFAYDLSEHSADTLNVHTTRPDFLSQPSSKGTFEFKAMKTGHTYRIVALIDEFRNYVFDPGIDAFGVANKDVVLTTPEDTSIHIRMAPKSDSVKPALQDFDPVDVYHLRAKFSEAMDSATARSDAFILKDSAAGYVPILSVYRDNIERKPSLFTLLLSKPMIDDKVYILDIAKPLVHDFAGNQGSDSSVPIHFSAPKLRDTFPPPRFIGFEFSDSSKGIAQAFDMRMNFTDAVDTLAIEQNLHLVDSTGKENSLIFKWIDGTKIRIQSKDELVANTFYKLTLDGKMVRSPLPSYVEKYKDTLYRVRFFTGDNREFGIISGEVSLADRTKETDTTKKITIQLLTSDGVVFRVVNLPIGKLGYIFEKVPRGKYRVRGWIGSAKEYDPGSVIPFRFGEPSGDYPDAIDVRPRWTVEKVNFEIK